MINWITYPVAGCLLLTATPFLLVSSLLSCLPPFFQGPQDARTAIGIANRGEVSGNPFAFSYGHPERSQGKLDVGQGCLARIGPSGLPFVFFGGRQKR